MLITADITACASRGSKLTGKQRCPDLTHFESARHGDKELAEAVQVGIGAGLEGGLEWPVQDLERRYPRQWLGRLKVLPSLMMLSDEMWKSSMAGPFSLLTPSPTACACLLTHLLPLSFQVCISSLPPPKRLASLGSRKEKNKQHF